MAEAAVTQGSLASIYANEQVRDPVLQVVHIKNLATTADAAERYRVVLSDIRNFMQCMIMISLNHLVTDNKLRKGCFIRLTDFHTNDVRGKKIIIIKACEVLEELGDCPKIGDPKAFEMKEDNGGTGQPAAIPKDNFYGKPAQNGQTSNPRRSETTTSSSHGNIYPIEALSPYAHKWTIRARCTHKSDIKTWHNKNGEGKLFSVNFLDESGEIRATGFNDAVDLFYDNIQEGQVYYISAPCRVQLAKKQFSNVNNDYELTFESSTVVEKAEDQDSVPQVRYNFTNIGDLQSVEKDSTIDTLGILTEVGEVSQITSKTTSKPYDKRELTLVDNTNFSVRLTIWGNAATTFDAAPESVVAFKGVKVSDFGGRSLSLLSSGSMNVDPDIDEAHKLKGWYDAQGRQDTFQSHANMGMTTGSGRKQEFKTVAAVRNEQLGLSGKTDYFTIKATIVYIKPDGMSYPACSSEGCNKKVIENDGQWRCEKCDKAYERPQYRYIMSANVCDYTDQLWLSFFDDVGRIVMGCSADELQELKENNEDLFKEKILDATCTTWIFNCRAKMDTYQDQERVRYQVSSANAINFTSECSRLADVLKQYSLESDSLFVS